MKEEDKEPLENKLLNLAKEGSLEKIEAIFKRAREDNKNINLNIRDEEGNTPLMLATINGNIELIKFLIKKGASLRLTNNKEQGVEELALQEWGDDDEDKVFNFLQDEATGLRKETLRKRFSELDQKLFKSSMSKDHSIEGLSYHSELLDEALLGKIGNLKIDQTPLNLKEIKGLLELRANPNQIFPETKSGNFGAGNTLLHKAALCSDPKLAELLLKYGADPFITNELVRTPLDLAIENHNHHIIDTLIVGQNQWKKKYLDPALFSSFSKLDRENRDLDLSEVQDALINGANPNSIHETGNTPIHEAAYFKDPSLASLLLEYGASLNTKNKEGKTPLQIAMEQGNIEVIKTFTHNNPVEKLTTKVNIVEDVDKVAPQSPTSVAKSLSPNSKKTSR